MSFSDWFYDYTGSLPDRQGPPMPRPDQDIRKAYLHWIEHDDLIWGGFFPHIQSWWDLRDRPNVLLLHFNELKADLEGTTRRIAAFLDIAIDEQRLPDILKHCGIEHMRALANKVEFLSMLFDGGGDSFINKGTNGRWRDVLSAEEIALCDTASQARLTPDCSAWLTSGTR
jgi:aryl sulfotransferase